MCVCLQVINWDGQPAGWLQLDGFYGLRWQSSGTAVDVAGNSQAQAFSPPNYLALTDSWHPTIRSYNGNAVLTLRSLTCVRLSYAAADSYAAIIGSVSGQVRLTFPLHGFLYNPLMSFTLLMPFTHSQEVYFKKLNCPAVNPAVNDFRREQLPAVDTLYVPVLMKRNACVC
jgi:hypothetical protein